MVEQMQFIWGWVALRWNKLLDGRIVFEKCRLRSLTDQKSFHIFVTMKCHDYTTYNRSIIRMFTHLRYCSAALDDSSVHDRNALKFLQRRCRDVVLYGEPFVSVAVVLLSNSCSLESTMFLRCSYDKEFPFAPMAYNPEDGLDLHSNIWREKEQFTKMTNSNAHRPTIGVFTKRDVFLDK